MIGLLFILVSVGLTSIWKIQISGVSGILGSVLHVLDLFIVWNREGFQLEFGALTIIIDLIIIIINIILFVTRVVSVKFDLIKIKRVDETLSSAKISELSINKHKKKTSDNIIPVKEIEKRLSNKELEELKNTEAEVGVEAQKFTCVVHKGAIEGNLYLCPNCHTLYCVRCATALKEKGEKCWTCSSDIKS